MRLFTAIDLDDEARERVAAEQQRVKTLLGGASSLKWTAPALIHVTLVFIGHADDTLAPAITAACAEPISDVRPFRVQFGGLGMFPPRGNPRVLWLGVAKGDDGVAAVHDVIERRLRKLDVVLEERPFHAHLTLGRWRDGRMRDRRAVEALSAGGAIAEIDVRDAVLYQSRLSSSGPAYTVLARAHLS